MTGNVLVAANFLINTLFGLYLGALWLRFVLARARADFSSPLAQLVVKVTNPLLWPLRRLIPPIGGIDLATFVLLALLAAVNLLIDLGLVGRSVEPLTLAGWTLLRLATVIVGTYTLTILLEALLSWTGQSGASPVARALAQVDAPLLRPLRRLIPPIGGFDLAPLFALIALQVVAILIPLDGWFR
jgi:YggT family protein